MSSAASCLVQPQQISFYQAWIWECIAAIDLKKAFNSLDQKVLLEKMICLGLKTSVIKWFESRKLLLPVSDICLEARLLYCSDPQKYILGPLLILIYIKNLSQSLTENGSSLYVNDTSIFYHNKDIHKIEDVATKEFWTICKWFANNKFPTHSGKDKESIFSFQQLKRSSKLDVCQVNHNIDQCHTSEYLGSLWFYSKWQIHGNESFERVNAKLQFFYRQHNCLKPRMKILLCNNLICPHFVYGCTSVFRLLNKDLKLKL